MAELYRIELIKSRNFPEILLYFRELLVWKCNYGSFIFAVRAQLRTFLFGAKRRWIERLYGQSLEVSFCGKGSAATVLVKALISFDFIG